MTAWRVSVAFVVFCGGGCEMPAQSPHVTLDPAARAVRVAKGDPPSDAQDLGPVEVSDGVCRTMGGPGTRGTYRRALISLRNRVAEMHGNYVQVMTITEPIPVADRCQRYRFTIRGLAFRLSAPQPEAEEPEEVGESACDPPCSPGYQCDSAVCQPLCNPPCASGQTCRQDRTCGPASPTTTR